MQLTRRETDAITVVGMDPSLRNWGLAKGTYYPHSGQLDIVTLDVIQAVIEDGKSVRNNSKDLSAAQQLAKAATQFMAGAKASYGICVGILGAIRAQDISFFELTEAEVKAATVGKKSKTTKREVIDWAMKRFPTAPWPMKTEKGVQSVVEGRAEHMADATGAIVAGIASQQFQQLLTFIR
jgi:hypothetical protein